MNNNINWYTIKVKASREEEVINKLNSIVQDNKLDVFKIIPLFKNKRTGYIFCKCIMDPKLIRIFNTIENLNFINNFGRNLKKEDLPTPTFNILNNNDEKMGEERVISKIISEGLFEKKIDKQNDETFKIVGYRNNDKVYIIDGYFSGFIGKVIYNKKNFLELKIRISGNEAEIKIDKKKCIKFVDTQSIIADDYESKN